MRLIFFLFFVSLISLYGENIELDSDFTAVAKHAGINEQYKNSENPEVFMAGILSRILIEASFVELEVPENQQTPMFYSLIPVKAQVLRLFMKLRNELARYYSMDTVYLEQELLKLQNQELSEKKYDEFTEKRQKLNAEEEKELQKLAAERQEEQKKIIQKEEKLSLLTFEQVRKELFKFRNEEFIEKTAKVETSENMIPAENEAIQVTGESRIISAGDIHPDTVESRTVSVAEVHPDTVESRTVSVAEVHPDTAESRIVSAEVQSGEKRQEELFSDIRNLMKNVEESLIRTADDTENTQEKKTGEIRVNAIIEKPEFESGLIYDLEALEKDISSQMSEVENRLEKFQKFRSGTVPFLVNAGNPSIPADKWLFSIRTSTFEDSSENTSAGISRAYLNYTPLRYLSISTGWDFQIPQSSGYYKNSSDYFLRIKTPLNSHELHPYRFSLAGEGHSRSGTAGEKYRMGINCGFYPPGWPGFALCGNLNYLWTDSKNRWITEFGMESRVWNLPLYILLESHRKKTDRNLFNMGLRFFSGKTVWDLIWENEENNHDRLGINVLWRFR